MILQGDCRDVLAAMEADSIDACVTDPPYELGFMGKAWDATGVAYDPATWAAVLRVLKPGGHLLAFGGTRTHHRMVCAIEDAGFEIRDEIQWLYGSGFPKSLDVSKAIDKAAGAERTMRVNEKWAERYPNGPGGNLSGDGRSAHFNQAKRITDGPLLTSDPATDAARQWDGWGTALKPACEPICVARKPLVGTVAANVQEHGTGALNIDGCRVGTEDNTFRQNNEMGYGGNVRPFSAGGHDAGRWPANVILGCACDGDHLEGCAVRMLDEQSGECPVGGGTYMRKPDGDDRRAYGRFTGAETVSYGDTGGASRFFKIVQWREEEWQSERSASTAERGSTPSGSGDASAPRAARAKRSPEKSTHGPVYINACENCIQTRNLAGVEPLENTGTIPITPTFCGLCGSALRVIGASTRPASAARVAAVSDPAGVTRFRYEAKPSRAERGDGNDHPTVKPVNLLRYLVRLVTPPGGTVLDPFAGSGTTLWAAQEEGFPYVGIELNPDYIAIAERRMAQQTLWMEAAL